MRLGGPKIGSKSRRANSYLFAAGALIVLFAPAASQAGVIFPQLDQRAADSPVCCPDVASSQSSDGDFGTSRTQLPPTGRQPAKHVNVDDDVLGNVPGGMSAPNSGANGPSTLTLLVPFDIPSGTQPVGSVFACWREFSPRLPRPPAEELLDPPKAALHLG